MNRRVLFVVAICSFFACFVCSNQSHAATLSVPVHMQATFDNPKVQCNAQTSWTDQCATSSNPIYFIKMATYNLDNFAIPTGNYYVEIILRSEGNLSYTSASSFITADIPSSSTISPIEVEQLAYSSSGAYQYYTYRVLGKYTGSATPPVVELGVTWNTTPWLWGGATGVDHITFWRIDDDSGLSTSDILNAIDSSSTLNSIDSGISDLRSTQEQANDDANDRYEDEKQTIQDNGDQAQDDMDDFTSSASFSLGNPIAGIFNYFVDTCTVQIPTISSWLGSTETSVTSWWCKTQKLQTIRNTVTTILSFTGVLLTFGFLIRWLRTNQGEA